MSLKWPPSLPVFFTVTPVHSFISFLHLWPLFTSNKRWSSSSSSLANKKNFDCASSVHNWIINDRNWFLSHTNFETVYHAPKRAFGLSFKGDAHAPITCTLNSFTTFQIRKCLCNVDVAHPFFPTLNSQTIELFPERNTLFKRKRLLMTKKKMKTLFNAS